MCIEPRAGLPFSMRMNLLSRTRIRFIVRLNLPFCAAIPHQGHQQQRLQPSGAARNLRHGVFTRAAAFKIKVQTAACDSSGRALTIASNHIKFVLYVDSKKCQARPLLLLLPRVLCNGKGKSSLGCGMLRALLPRLVHTAHHRQVSSSS